MGFEAAIQGEPGLLTACEGTRNGPLSSVAIESEQGQQVVTNGPVQLGNGLDNAPVIVALRPAFYHIPPYGSRQIVYAVVITYVMESPYFLVTS